VGEGKWSTSESHWMLFLDVENDGVLGWQDWQTFNFGNSNWDYTGTHDWLPDYHGDALFLKIHRPPRPCPTRASTGRTRSRSSTPTATASRKWGCAGSTRSSRS